jgi:hypothetical protein
MRTSDHWLNASEILLASELSRATRNRSLHEKRGDDYLFHAGDVCGHNVVLATLPAGQEYDTGSAAALASQVKKFFPNGRYSAR